VIFALMQRNDPGKPPEPGTPEGFTIKAGGAEIPVGSSGDVNRDLGNAGDLMRRRAE
jgi:hypothetical protein